ncbi:hypothetical protein P7K49_024948, partial [Saguinus oedipus]
DLNMGSESLKATHNMVPRDAEDQMSSLSFSPKTCSEKWIQPPLTEATGTEPSLLLT